NAPGIASNRTSTIRILRKTGSRDIGLVFLSGDLELFSQRADRPAGNDLFDSGIALRIFIHDDVSVGRQVGQLLDLAGGPANGQLLDSVGVAQAEMNDIGHLGSITVQGVHLADKWLTSDRGDQAGADPQSIAGISAEGNLQIVFLWEIIFVEDEGP